MRDTDGRIVHDETFLSPRGSRPRQTTLASLPYGWYEAAMEVRSGSGLVGARWLAFVRLLPQRRMEALPPTGLAVKLPAAGLTDIGKMNALRWLEAGPTGSYGTP